MSVTMLALPSSGSVMNRSGKPHRTGARQVILLLVALLDPAPSAAQVESVLNPSI